MMRRAPADLLEQLPEELRDSPEAKVLRAAAGPSVYNIVHPIHRAKNYEAIRRFSQRSMEEHWRAGRQDARRTLRHAEVLKRPVIMKESLLSISPRTVVTS
jgi:NTE family protein